MDHAEIAFVVILASVIVFSIVEFLGEQVSGYWRDRFKPYGMTLRMVWAYFWTPIEKKYAFLYAIGETRKNRLLCLLAEEETSLARQFVINRLRRELELLDRQLNIDSYMRPDWISKRRAQAEEEKDQRRRDKEKAAEEKRVLKEIEGKINGKIKVKKAVDIKDGALTLAPEQGGSLSLCQQGEISLESKKQDESVQRNSG